jgi:rhodanese-related sulfurtransferase
MKTLVGAMILLALGAGQGAAQNIPPELIRYADSIIYNGKVLTVDKNFTIAQAVALRDGKILAVGTNADIQRLAGSRSIPAEELQKRLGEIPKSGRVVIYAAAASNDIPAAVFQLFEDERYKNITVMLEGFQGWEKRKFPVVAGKKK